MQPTSAVHPALSNFRALMEYRQQPHRTWCSKNSYSAANRKRAAASGCRRECATVDMSVVDKSIPFRFSPCLRCMQDLLHRERTDPNTLQQMYGGSMTTLVEVKRARGQHG